MSADCKYNVDCVEQNLSYDVQLWFVDHFRNYHHIDHDLDYLEQKFYVTEDQLHNEHDLLGKRSKASCEQS